MRLQQLHTSHSGTGIRVNVSVESVATMAVQADCEFIIFLFVYLVL